MGKTTFVVISCLIFISFNNCSKFESMPSKLMDVSSSASNASSSSNTSSTDDSPTDSPDPSFDFGTSEIPTGASGDGYDIQGTPRTGKWPGDQPDIGAYEWIPKELQTSDGRWNGKKLTCDLMNNKCPGINVSELSSAVR